MKKIYLIGSLLLVIAVVVGGTIYFLSRTSSLESGGTDDKTAREDNPKDISINPRPHIPNQPSSDNSDNELVIEQWGVKMNMRDASKISYEYKDLGSNKQIPGGLYSSLIVINIDQQYLNDKDCKGASLGLYRLDSYTKDSGWQSKEINGVHYLITGSPYLCDGGSNSEDNILVERVLEDFKIENLFPVGMYQ